MKEFIATNLTNQVPADICSECAKNGVLHEPTETLIVHCAHQITGAYKAPKRDWITLRGIEGNYFRESVLRGLIMGELKHDVERGLLGIIQNESIDTVKH